MAVPSVDERLDQLASMLPESMRYNDEAERALRGLLKPIARIDNYLSLKREQLLGLHQAELVPDELVRHLAATVGFGLDLSATSVLATATLRSLTPGAVALWKVSGTQPAIRRVLAAVLGSRGWILSWFQLRTVTGTAGEIHVIPSPGSGSGAYFQPEWTTDVWYMDPDASAPPDITELVAVLGVIRASCERLNLRRALLLDDLEGGEAFWARQSAGTYVYEDAAEDEGRQHVLSDGAGFYPDFGGLSAAWTSYRWTVLLRTAGEAHLYVLAAAEGDEGNAYRVEIDEAAAELRIVRIDAGVASPPITVPLAISPTHSYRWSVEVSVAPAATTLRVYLEGALMTSIADLSPGRYSAGSVQFGADIGVGNAVAVRGALLWAEGVVTTRVGLDP